MRLSCNHLGQPCIALTLRKVTFARLVLGENSRPLCDDCVYLNMFRYVTQLQRCVGLVGRTRDMIMERMNCSASRRRVWQPPLCPGPSTPATTLFSSHRHEQCALVLAHHRPRLCGAYQSINPPETSQSFLSYRKQSLSYGLQSSSDSDSSSESDESKTSSSSECDKYSSGDSGSSSLSVSRVRNRSRPTAASSS